MLCIPIIHRGSAMAVTQMSAMAKLIINSFPDLFIPFITVETRRINVFPQVPIRIAIPIIAM